MIYVMLANGFEEIEALTVVDVLRRASLDVNLVSCEESLSVKGAHEITVQADVFLSECSLAKAEALVLPGGMPGTLNLRKNEALIQLLKDAHKKEIKIAAICAAPMILGQIGLLCGLKAVSYPGFEEDLIGSIPSEDRVVTDGFITTSKGPGTAMEFAFRLVELLKEKETAEKLKGDMLAR